MAEKKINEHSETNRMRAQIGLELLAEGTNGINSKTIAAVTKYLGNAYNDLYDSIEEDLTDILMDDPTFVTNQDTDEMDDILTTVGDVLDIVEKSAEKAEKDIAKYLKKVKLYV